MIIWKAFLLSWNFASMATVLKNILFNQYFVIQIFKAIKKLTKL